MTNICFALTDGDDGTVEEDSMDDVDMYITPTSGQAVPTNSLVVEWAYDGYLTGAATIGVFYYPDEEDTDDYTTSRTTVDWSESSVTIPPSDLPHVDPGSTNSIWVDVFTITAGDGSDLLDYWTVSPYIALYAPETHTPSTVTQTVTASPSTDPGPTPTGEGEGESEGGEGEGELGGDGDGDADGGLSAGGKAGVGVGVSAGAILVAAGAFLLVRRRKRQEPKTIREIPATSATNLHGP